MEAIAAEAVRPVTIHQHLLNSFASDPDPTAGWQNTQRRGCPTTRLAVVQ
jgi:hypothetical protein